MLWFIPCLEIILNLYVQIKQKMSIIPNKFTIIKVKG